MNKDDMLLEILDYVKEIDLKQYNKLQKLVVAYFNVEDKQNKKIVKKKLSESIYKLYLSCIDKKTRRRIMNNLSDIYVDWYRICKKNKDIDMNWYFNFDGLYRMLENKDKAFIITDRIPRGYEKARDNDKKFYLRVEHSEREKEFYRRNFGLLFELEMDMTMQERLNTHNYQTSNPNLPTELIRLIIDYLELPRMPQEKAKDLDIEKYYSSIKKIIEEDKKIRMMVREDRKV